MHSLTFATLAVTGIVSCAEFGSYAFVHPVLGRLPVTERISVEQGLLKTLGRMMPVGMTLCAVLANRTVMSDDGQGTLSWFAAATS